MRILHYSLGLPPYRSGGLTKYSYDLMKEQVKNEDDVYALFPGEILLFNSKVRIKPYKEYDKIKVYELINPLPVSLLSGISTAKKFMKVSEKQVFIDFLINNLIEVIHIHTFMGLYRELLEACKVLKIKILYTTHDYFGLCTRVNFIDSFGEQCDNRDLYKCIKCNRKAYNIKTIGVLQSPIYRFLKEKNIIEKMKPSLIRIKGLADKESKFIEEEINEIKLEEVNEFQELLNYYEDMYKYIDKFLFNSNISKLVYNNYIDVKGEVIAITHSDIKDNRINKIYKNNDKLKLTYLGPDKKHKGFNLLIEVMSELNKRFNENIELNLYGDIENRDFDSNNIFIKGKYKYKELDYIFKKTDVLIVPSIWNETFGFIVLEALSYGVPVIITEKVGSKDLIDNTGMKKGIIVGANKKDIVRQIEEIINNKDILKELNSNILNGDFNILMENHYKEINRAYENTEAN